MTRDEAVAIMKQKLGFRLDLDTECVRALVQAQMEFETAQTLPWFLIEEDATFSLVADTQEYALPTGFLLWVEDELPHYTDSDTDDRVYLRRLKPDDAALYFNDTENEKPLSFVQRKSSILVYPTPDASYTLTYSYYKAADAIDESSMQGSETNAWLTYNPYRLIGRAGQLLAQDLEYQEAERRFTEMLATWTAWEKRHEAQRDESGRPVAMGRNK